ALKYTPADTRVTIVAEKVDRGVVLSVSDEGAGIPEHARERVFERFYQVDQSTTRSVGGTGLGLYICRKMADTIGAELSLTSPADGGSAFSLRIPSEPPTARDRSAEGGDARGEAEPDPSDQSITASV